ncbi:ABC transporter permease [Chitinophaga arvensicola]|uniref:ABC-type transport system, involved in lipoprotein release, permease component n=1 Tax=Chitinophaga arvensicola TaxID=29529 RepID=A0A1I0SA99_9BACT|nr:ABC transporter permease [Chitinophaga arvensicola]SEW53045.1 ABC-type transport system, involved in lipoprotein release, permease component [Chitinophaga arvensicola]
MLKNYFIIAWRNLIRNKRFSFINISGLSIGMAGVILIMIWIQHEVSFDNFHPAKDRLYEAYGLAKIEGHLQAINETSQPLGPAMKAEFPEVENTTRFIPLGGVLFTAGNTQLSGLQGGVVDPAFLEMFRFPLKTGAAKEQLATPNSIIITQELAIKLFGTEDALNKTIRIETADVVTVTGVLKTLPSNSRFHFEYLLPWAFIKQKGWVNDSWLSNSISTFVLLQPHTNVTAFNARFSNFSQRHTGKTDVWTHFLHPLDKWHLYSSFENGKATGGRITMVRLFGVIAGFILLIACINFMNLSTARSEQRAKEVGIRKVAGAGKGLLIRQFMTESFVTVCISALGAILIVIFAIRPFNQLINEQLSIPWKQPYGWLAAAGFILFTSILAGAWPAFYLASFSPAGIFQRKFKKVNAFLSPRKVLVVIQFSFAIVLIIATIAVRNQIRYAQDRQTGYSQNNLIRVHFTGEIEKNYALIKQELLSSGVAVGVSKNMWTITERGTNTWGLRWSGKKEGNNPTIALFSTDADLVKTAELQLVAGRDINIQQYPSDSFAVLLNETAVKTMGFNAPLGQVISQADHRVSWHVVGVVKDYVLNSPYETIPPLVIQGPGSWFNTMHIRFSKTRSTADNLQLAAAIFKKYNSAYPFDYRFIDDEYARNFENEQRIKALAGLFSALAISISCLGLLGLSAYMAENRTKEIGVRKILGASVLSITRLLSVDFIKLILVAILIASPVAWYAIHRWLQNYVYHAPISWSIFVLAGLMAIVIALVTISYQSLKAALMNPVKSLKSE